MIDQIGIAVFGVSAVFLSQLASEKYRRFACFFGLFGQVFWMHLVYPSSQWGVMVVVTLYTMAWTQGLWEQWIQPGIEGRKLKAKRQQVYQVAANVCAFCFRKMPDGEGFERRRMCCIRGYGHDVKRGLALNHSITQ